MQIKADALPAHLARGKLAPLYVVSGDEPLLAIEAQDAIRAAARKAGFTEREVVHADGRFDWSIMAGAAQGMSLFAERRILEIRLPGGKPGKEGGAALAAHAAAPNDELLTIVALPALDWKVRKAGWPVALEQAGVWVDVPQIARAQLPAWLAARLARQHQKAPRDALEFLADAVEGNLLAAHQELGKLALLYPAAAGQPRELGVDDVRDAVLDVARFEILQLPLAMLEGRPERVLRTIEGLRAEGEPLPLVLWWISEEVRTLLRLRTLLDRGTPWAQAAREVWLRREKEGLTQRACERLTQAALAPLLARCADVDRVMKGLRARGADSDAWLELTDIALAVASPAAPSQ